MTKLSIVTPAYNEAQNLPVLYDHLQEALEDTKVEWEWIVVDDHSTDETSSVLVRLAEQDGRLLGFRLARNAGTHMAIACGLHHAKGHCAVVLNADLQDPPAIIQQMVAEWEQGAHVVWAVRTKHNGRSAVDRAFSRLYWGMMRRVSDLKSLPSRGSDFFLVDRCVIEALNRFSERNVCIYTLITWMGFRQEYITYDRQPRLHGHSGWNVKKKIKLVIDSITSFTYFPIRLMSYVGFISALLGFMYAGVVIFNAVHGRPVEGWSSLMIVLLVLGGIQMLMLGVLGEYLWRDLDEARRRPQYIVEAVIGQGGQKWVDGDEEPLEGIRGKGT